MKTARFVIQSIAIVVGLRAAYYTFVTFPAWISFIDAWSEGGIVDHLGIATFNSSLLLLAS